MRTLPGDTEAPLHYVALGDSTVAGVGGSSYWLSYPSRLLKRLQTIYPQARLTNLGMGGALAPDVVEFELDRAVALEPQLTTLSIGPNDVTGGEDLDVYRASLVTIFNRLCIETAAVMVVNTIPDMSLATRFSGAEKQRVGRLAVLFNDAITESAQRFDVEVVDLYTPSRALGTGYGALLSEDGYHPSDLGYEKWAELMWVGIERRLGSVAAQPEG